MSVVCGDRDAAERIAQHASKPTFSGRIIDLSYGAAKTLDLKARGLQRVRLDIVEPETVAMLRGDSRISQLADEAKITTLELRRY